MIRTPGQSGREVTPHDLLRSQSCRTLRVQDLTWSSPCRKVGDRKGRGYQEGPRFATLYAGLSLAVCSVVRQGGRSRTRPCRAITVEKQTVVGSCKRPCDTPRTAAKAALFPSRSTTCMRHAAHVTEWICGFVPLKQAP